MAVRRPIRIVQTTSVGEPLKPGLSKCLWLREPHPFILLIPFTADKMKIDPPSYGISRIRRLISADGKIAFLHGLLDGTPEFHHIFDLGLVDFHHHGPHRDTRIVGSCVTYTHQHCDALRQIELQFLLSFFIDFSHDDSELLTKLSRLFHRHTGRLTCRLGSHVSPHSAHEPHAQKKGPPPTKGLYAHSHTVAASPLKRNPALSDRTSNQFPPGAAFTTSPRDQWTAGTMEPRPSVRSVLCSHRSTRQTPQSAPVPESAWLRFPAPR